MSVHKEKRLFFTIKKKIYNGWFQETPMLGGGFAPAIRNAWSSQKERQSPWAILLRTMCVQRKASIFHLKKIYVMAGLKTGL